MPQLASYSNTHVENQSLLAALHTGLLQNRFAYHVTMSDSALWDDGNAASYATVAKLRVTQAVHGKDPVEIEMTQLANRFNTGGPYSQLVLLDTSDETEMHGVFTDEEANTYLKDPIKGTKYEGNNYRFLVKNAPRLKANFTAKKLDPDFKQLIVKQAPYKNKLNPTPQEKLRRNKVIKLMREIAFGMHYNHYRNNYRVGHHSAKSSDRISSHFGELASLVQTSKAVTRFTAARGEYASVKVLQTLFDNARWEMKKGMAKSGGQNGIDQIWVKRTAKGDIQSYLLVEAKGSAGAHVGITTEGVQMSPRWVVYVLMRMASGDGRYIDTSSPNQSRTAKKILDAIFDDSRAITVAGLKVHSLYDSHDLMNHVVEVMDLGTYNNPGVLTTLRAPPPKVIPTLNTGITTYY